MVFHNHTPDDPPSVSTAGKQLIFPMREESIERWRSSECWSIKIVELSPSTQTPDQESSGELLSK